MKNKSICIIPARGGSKRIPKKNIKSFLGFPIIKYSIDAAFGAEVFEEVYVSTDDNDVANIAKKYGAKCDRLRSKNNSNDFSTTFDVLDEVLNYPEIFNKKYDYACCLYPTSPLINSEILTKSHKILKESKFNSVIPVTKFSYPIQRALNRENDGLISFENDKLSKTRTQDLNIKYHDAGMFYFFKIKTLIKQKELFCKPSYGLLINELAVQDIDTMDDWALAELKFKHINDII